MSIAAALRTIEADLRKALAEPEGIDRDIIELATRRLSAQAEMVELGIDALEPAQ